VGENFVAALMREQCMPAQQEAQGDDLAGMGPTACTGPGELRREFPGTFGPDIAVSRIW
jgi:hypothetical protein